VGNTETWGSSEAHSLQEEEDDIQKEIANISRQALPYVKK